MGETLTYLQVKRWREGEGASDYTAFVIVRSRSSRRIRHVMGRVLNGCAFPLTFSVYPSVVICHSFASQITTCENGYGFF